MSLDVTLKLPSGAHHVATDRIFIREGGQNKELTRAEWDERYPDKEPFIVSGDEGGEVYWANITHNLGRMAQEAGVYAALWEPGETGYTHAEQLIAPLRDGLALLESDPERFKVFNPSNKWGDYSNLVQFVKSYLEACERYPTAEVSVSR